MKDQHEKKVLQRDKSDADDKRKRLVFIGQESMLTAQALYTGCCVYVSTRMHRQHN